MKIKVAHIRIQGINVAVFAADARRNTNSARSELLGQLTAQARAQGLRVEKSALAYRSGTRVNYYGSRDLVQYLSRNGVYRWTHTIQS